ncbi:hypothetical protein [Pseudoxanthomonas sp.]|uniref:hypothetical protein n=1 Tax=Pseudoxanthomonas sp. TaxID=1871049 RepID=UPI0025F15EC5|nr:hypothetical protein [Pseudoxanthomonas sp.]
MQSIRIVPAPLRQAKVLHWRLPSCFCSTTTEKIACAISPCVTVPSAFQSMSRVVMPCVAADPV